MRLGLVTCLWGRPRLSRLFLEYYDGLTVPGVELTGVAVASAGDPSLPLYEAFPPLWRTVYHPNTFLSDKFNAGVAALRGSDIGGVVILGSDDFASPEYLAACATVTEGFAFTDVLYVFDAPTRRMIEYHGARIGAGVFVSRALLDRLGFMPYPPGETSVDGNFLRRTLEASKRDKSAGLPLDAYREGRLRSGILLDVKTPQSKNSFDTYLQHHHRVTEINGLSFLRQHMPDLTPRLLALAEH